MQLQQFDPKFITVTQFRRGIGVLEKILAKYGEAWIIRNQEVLFIALTPEKYLELTGKTLLPYTGNTKINNDKKLKIKQAQKFL